MLLYIVDSNASCSDATLDIEKQTQLLYSMYFIGMLLTQCVGGGSKPDDARSSPFLLTMDSKQIIFLSTFDTTSSALLFNLVIQNGKLTQPGADYLIGKEHEGRVGYNLEQVNTHSRIKPFRSFFRCDYS